jgi:hypothetical protein
MAMNLIWLEECDPDPNDGCYILIEADRDGTCYASGVGSSQQSDVLYISTVESDETLLNGIEAAVQWAKDREVSVIYLRKSREESAH